MLAKSKLLTFGLVGTIVFPVVSQTVYAGSFPDVSEYHEYANEIEYVKENGIASGWSDGTFKPANNITRGEVARMVIAAKYSEQEIANCLEDNGFSASKKVFSDMADDNKFVNYICMAKVNNIVSGYSDGTYRSTENINYAAAAKIIMRTLSPSADISSIALDAQLTDYTNLLSKKGVTPPTVSDPKVLINRGEFAYLVQIVRDGYVKLADEPNAPSIEFGIKTKQDITVSEYGLKFRIWNHGLNCNSRGLAFVELNVTNSAGQSQKIYLERKCDGTISKTADAFGYHFSLVNVIEHELWQANTFEYRVSIEKRS